MKYNYDYDQAVEADVRAWIAENYTAEQLAQEMQDTYDFQEKLHDALWVEDSVTGNGSGSYTFSREVAKEYVLGNVGALVDALREFDVDKRTICEYFFAEDWEYFDVTIRCAALDMAIARVLRGANHV